MNRVAVTTTTRVVGCTPTLSAHQEQLSGRSSFAAMVSAVEQVFGIPELVEQIFVAQDGGEPIVSDRALFVLQRVSRSIRNTILTSIHLRRQMGLEYQKRAKVAPPPPPTSYMSRLWGNVRSPCRFKYADILGAEIKGYIRCFDISSTADQVIRQATPTNIFEQTPLLNASWRKLQVFMYCDPAVIAINFGFKDVQKGFDEKGHECVAYGTYSDTVTLDAGEQTLGKLVDTMLAMYREHLDKCQPHLTPKLA